MKSLKNGQSDKDLFELAKILNIKLDAIDFDKNLFKNDITEGNYFTNLGELPSGGTHWVGFKLYKNYLFYYDSFGFRPKKIIIDFCKINDLKLLYNIDEFQNLKSALCGLYVMLFFLLDSYSFVKNKSDFDQLLNEMKFWEIEV